MTLQRWFAFDCAESFPCEKHYTHRGPARNTGPGAACSCALLCGLQAPDLCCVTPRTAGWGSGSFHGGVRGDTWLRPGRTRTQGDWGALAALFPHRSEVLRHDVAWSRLSPEDRLTGEVTLCGVGVQWALRKHHGIQLISASVTGSCHLAEGLCGGLVLLGLTAGPLGVKCTLPRFEQSGSCALRPLKSSFWVRAVCGWFCAGLRLIATVTLLSKMLKMWLAYPMTNFKMLSKPLLIYKVGHWHRCNSWRGSC